MGVRFPMNSEDKEVAGRSLEGRGGPGLLWGWDGKGGLQANGMERFDRTLLMMGLWKTPVSE